jgi:hypothetical protein
MRATSDGPRKAPKACPERPRSRGAQPSRDEATPDGEDFEEIGIDSEIRIIF